MGQIYVISVLRKVPGTYTEEDLYIKGRYEGEQCIKIGYTENLSSRFSSYNTDTPEFDRLFLIDNATVRDEKRLHKYFKDFQDDKLNGNEWFVWDIEIMKFFKEHKTIKEIRSAIPEGEITDKMIEKSKDIITPVINIMVENGIGYKKEDFKDEPDYVISKSLLNKNVSRTHYYVDVGEFLDFLKSNGDIREDEFELILSKLKEYEIIKEELKKFNSTHLFDNKMRFVCELGKTLDKDKFNLFLNSIPISYKKYYTILGPKKCSACRYLKRRMEEEAYRTVNQEDIINIDVKSGIISHFKVGKRYTCQYTKVQLGVIYDSYGYQKCPKSTDIQEFLEVKEVLMTDPMTKKRIRGYRIIRAKT